MEIIDLCPRRSCWLENCISGSEIATLALCKIYSEEGLLKNLSQVSKKEESWEDNSILSFEIAVGDSWEEAAFLSVDWLLGDSVKSPLNKQPMLNVSVDLDICLEH